MFLGRLLAFVVVVSHSALLVAHSSPLAAYLAPHVESFVAPLAYSAPPISSLFLLVGGFLVSWVV